MRWVWANPDDWAQTYVTGITNDPNVPAGYILTYGSDGGPDRVLYPNGLNTGMEQYMAGINSLSQSAYYVEDPVQVALQPEWPNGVFGSAPGGAPQDGVLSSYPQQALLMPGIQNYWRLEGAGPWSDSVGGVQLNSTGTTPPTQVAALTASATSAQQFTNAQILTAQATVPALGTVWSIFGMLQVASLTASAYVIRDGAGANNIYVSSTGQLVVQGPALTGPIVFGPPVFWCVTSDGTTVRVYLNGQLEAQKTVVATLPAGVYTIGPGSTGNNPLTIGEVALCTAALSRTQVGQMNSSVSVA